MPLDIDHIQSVIQQLLGEEGGRQMESFEGYSANDLSWIIYELLGENCPIQLQSCSELPFDDIPLFKMAKSLLQVVSEENDASITLNGFGLLPEEVVHQVIQRALPHELPSNEGNLHEMKWESLHMARLLCEVSGLLHIKTPSIQLSAKGKDLLENDTMLFKELIVSHLNSMNWAYFDDYGDNKIAQKGSGLSLVLLHKFGSEWRPVDFYASHYFKAFPTLKDVELLHFYQTHAEALHNCYSVRTFRSFLHQFGLVEFQQSDTFGAQAFVKVTPLFDEVFKVLPPAV
jgi:hypothetical protein